MHVEREAPDRVVVGLKFRSRRANGVGGRCTAAKNAA
jgi:hypothetical protein